MGDLVIWSIVIILIMGLVLRGFGMISWRQFLIVAVLISAIGAPAISSAGTHIARSNATGGFSEYWNGYEIEANWVKIPCSQDGPCVHEYDCDPYDCNPHDCNCRCTSTDPKTGECTNTECDTCYDTCYHDCPYCKEEWTFTVTTTLGDKVIAENRFPDDPQKHRWRRGHSIPKYVIDDAGVGVPEFWREVEARVNSGNPGPVTDVRSYVNYILASQNAILERYSDDVDQYKKDGLLPTLSSNLKKPYFANKVYPVGFHPQDEKAWQDAAMRFNAALGTELQGDLHVVIVQDERVTNPDEYLGALMAYWLGPELGKKALSKNGIVVVLGTKDGKTVDWARAETGMPLGNEGMLYDIQNDLKGVPLTPEVIFGNPKGEFFTENNGEKSVHVVHGLVQGALESILWGEHKFQRVCMECKEEGGIGFSYLKNEIQPTLGQKIVILVVASILYLILWGISLAVIHRFSPNDRMFEPKFDLNNYNIGGIHVRLPKLRR